MTCDEARLTLGALVLGALGEQEASEVRAHLRSCAPCRAEYEELTGMPRLMGLVPVAEVAAGPPAAAPVVRDVLLQQVAAERSGQRRRRIGWTAIGVTAIAAAAAAIGFGLAGGGSVEEPEEPPSQVLAGTDSGTGVWAKVELDGVAWGTRVDLQLSGAAPGETCRLVAVTADGEREVASTWTVPAVAPERGYLSVPGATGLVPELIHTLEVVTSDGRTLLRLDQSDAVAEETGSALSFDGHSTVRY